MRKRSKAVILRNSGSFVRRKDGDVGIKMFRGIILQEGHKRVISPETIECEIRIIYFRKVVIQVSLVKEKDMKVFEGDLLLGWMEENSSVMNLLAVHSEDDYIEDLTSYFKVDDSMEVSEWIKTLFQSSSEVVNIMTSLCEMGKVPTTILQKKDENISDIGMNVDGR